MNHYCLSQWVYGILVMATQVDEYTVKTDSRKWQCHIWLNLLKREIKQEIVIENALEMDAKDQN